MLLTESRLHKIIIYVTLFVCLQQVVVAEDATSAPTQTAAPTAAPTVAPTTQAPKVNVKDSSLCKKCTCDFQNLVLDCSNKQLNTWFTDEEWNTIQNGDSSFNTLNFNENKLTTVPELPTNSIKNLYLSNNLITEIAKGAFRNMSELVKLDLSHNQLESKALTPDVFQGGYSPKDYQPLKNLIELDLGHNLLHNLHQDLFEHLPNLETLILCKNPFQVIDHLSETAIAGLTSLKTLDLSYMELNDLPDNLLHGPRDLETLILTGNLLDELPDNIELGINLKHLVLDENPLANLTGENIFPAFKSLEYLSISYIPELQIIGPGAFSNLQKLNYLIAASNPKLTEIDVMAFAKKTVNPEIFDYPPIEKLYLHNNNLSTLDRDILKRWDKVQEIDLRFNPWSCDCSNSWLVETLMQQINSTSPIRARNIECATPADLKDMPLIEVFAQQKLSDCDHGNDGHSGNSGAWWAGILIGIFVGVPLSFGGLFFYRRGCFGLLRNARRDSARTLYNRPDFQDDFHI